MEGDLERLAAGAAPGAKSPDRGAEAIRAASSGPYGYAAFPQPFGTFYVAFGARGPAYAKIASSAAAFERDATRYLGSPVTRTSPPRELADAVESAIRRHETFRGPVDLNRVGPFEREVLAALRRIPAGHVRTYREIAQALGEPGAARAVGAACARNPLPLLIPCHRVVRSDGGLGGYSLRGGVGLKRRLLEAEGALPNLLD
jgi:methylated-DNA-[protein]-cysteine S-methyltransferase